MGAGGGGDLAPRANIALIQRMKTSSTVNTKEGNITIKSQS